jgi:hypothetical protein
VRLAALALAALALTGCETSAEKSAKLEKEAKLHASKTVRKGLLITQQSTRVKVLRAIVVSSTEGSAVVVTLHNTSAQALRDVPVAITVREARGTTVYSNSAPGLARTLVSAPLLAAHGELSWIDDQVPAGGRAAAVSAKVGEAPLAAGAIPRISVEGSRLFEDPTNGVGAEGTIVNHSHIAQQELVVYALALRSGQVVAAGRGVLPLVPAGGSTPFQVFFIGSPRGAQLAVSAPPTTLG